MNQPAPRDDAELEELLSRPTAAVVETLRQTSGDVIVLGAGGKMGPSLTAMVRRATDAIGDRRRIIAVSRFSSDDAAHTLESAGVEVVRADLGEREQIARLPDAPNVIYMAGQKFGTRDLPSRTWAVNTLVPAMVAERYASSRIVAFSTGNVYPMSPASSSGSREADSLTPLGEYANSCVGRERVLEHVSRTRGTRMSIIRLNYAVDLRYGVIVDIAHTIMSGEPVRLEMGFVNVIWQGDANAQAIASLTHAASPPFVVNVTGSERLAVRDVAKQLAALLGRPLQLQGIEAPDALLSDTSLAQSVFGQPSVSTPTLIGWVADWVGRGGTKLGKATKFEVRDGRY
jgi:uncharacterized protein YbjT (DUF2867 family)